MIHLIPPPMSHLLMNSLLLGQADDGSTMWTRLWDQWEPTLTQWAIVLVVIAVLVVPYLIGNFLARQLKMPTYGFRIGTILFAITAASAVLTFGRLDWGVDLRGGTILVYELDPSASIQREAEGGRTDVKAADVIPALVKRINPSGTQEIVIRPYGDRQIEIIIPDVDSAEVEFVKRQIIQAGILRFAIVANSRDHGSLIETAIEASESENRERRMSRTVEDATGRTIGFWAEVDRE